jgi:hypothetical protein
LEGKWRLLPVLGGDQDLDCRTGSRLVAILGLREKGKVEPAFLGYTDFKGLLGVFGGVSETWSRRWGSEGTQ